MHSANSTPYASPTLTLENGKVVTLLITQRMNGVEVSAPLYWPSGKVPEEFQGDGLGDPELSHFEHSGGELLPRRRTTVAAVQGFGAAYNEVEGAVRWVSMNFGSLSS